MLLLFCQIWQARQLVGIRLMIYVQGSTLTCGITIALGTGTRVATALGRKLPTGICLILSGAVDQAPLVP